MAKNLFDYRLPQYAGPTLKALKAAWPSVRFDVAPSTLQSYAFRYLIYATLPDGTRAPVRRAPRHSLVRHGLINKAGDYTFQAGADTIRPVSC
jgi:hypothetical protein